MKNKEFDLATAGIRPLILRSINFMFRSSPANKGLRTDILIDEVVSKTRLTDFGQDFQVEGLDILTNSLKEEARLSQLGAIIMKKRLRDALEIRLKANQLFKDYPEILEREVLPIWLITGLQRTGTTLLQRLLSVDPSARALLSWEAFTPIPGTSKNEKDKRIKKARNSAKALKWMSPSFFSIHPIDHLAPEEDILLLDSAFITTAPEAIAHVPSYSKWVEAQDSTLAYEWEKRLLKLLQWQKGGKRWILKSPHHLEFLNGFTKTFPDTRIIWSHRNPIECIPSFLSMVYHARAMFSSDVRIDEIREHWLNKTDKMLRNGMGFYNSYPDNFYNMDFENIVKDPVIEISKVYKYFGVQWSDVLGKIANQFIEGNERFKFGKHVYNPNDFYLNNKIIEAKYSKYLAFSKAIFR